MLPSTERPTDNTSLQPVVFTFYCVMPLSSRTAVAAVGCAVMAAWKFVGDRLPPGLSSVVTTKYKYSCMDLELRLA
jgi:hypothetical protein